MFEKTVWPLIVMLTIIGCGNDNKNTSSDTSGAPSSTDETNHTTDSSGPDSATGQSDTGPGTGKDTETLPLSTPLSDRLTVTDLNVGDGVMAGVRNWRIWSWPSLDIAPVYTAPIDSGETLVGFTTQKNGVPTPNVAVVGQDDTLVNQWALDPGLICRGLAAEPDGHFAALLWDDDNDQIFVTKYDPTGAEIWHTELVNSDNTPDDFGIGESRLEYGNNRYGAYYHVHSNSGHEGDTLKWVDAASGDETTQWGWGCSHSMSNLLRFNKPAQSFLPVCVTDCYPGTSGDFATQSKGGIYINHNDAKVMDVDGGCNGSVAGELGGAAPYDGGWALVFNAHQAPVTLGQDSYDDATMNQDIGLSLVEPQQTPTAVTWLTNTPGINEADATVASWQPLGATSQQFIVGWSESGTNHQLARINDAGTILEGPIDSAAGWGKRDDPFRTAANGDVVWAWFDSAGSATLHFARLDAGL